MLFTDTAVIDGPARITRDGYLVAEARVAKANNVQTYSAGELGLTDRAASDQIRVFRPESEVFAKDALASIAHRPLTLDHPTNDVTAENWRDLSVGDVGGDVLRDGDFIRMPFKVMDSKAVKAAQTTHREFSLGYSADLAMTPGVFDGQAYDAVMKDIRGNHLALVPMARGGPDLRIVDERPAHIRDHQEPPMKKIMLDGLQVDLSDAAAVEIAIGKLQSNLTDAQGKVGTLTAELATANTTIQTRDGEIAVLKKQVEDAAVTPEKLQQLADSRAKVIADAKKVAGDALVVDGKTEAEIRKAAVMAKLGDSAKDMADAAIEGAFTALLGSPAASSHAAPNGAPVNVGDAKAVYETARAARREELTNGWKRPAQAA